MKKANLTLVGTGIQFLSHITIEAESNIKQAEKLLYLVNNPVLSTWLQQANPQHESLEDLYFSDPDRQTAYQAITDRILHVLTDTQHVCVAFYGHPCIYARSGLDAVKKAKMQGHNVKILPAISAQDCLYADLCIDPGSHGCLSYDASDFLFRDKLICNASHLILWQINATGILDHQVHANPKALALLQAKLLQHYPPMHPVIIYEAAQLPGFSAIVLETTMQDFPYIKLNDRSTMYVPPQQIAPLNQNLFQSL